MNANATVLRELARSIDPVVFARTALNFDPEEWQADFLRSTHPRIIMNCPRGAGKSLLTAITALHHALFTQNAFVMLFSRSERQSMELFRKIIDFYKLLQFTPTAESAHRLELANGSRILSLPSSVETVIGYHDVTLLVIDEAALCSEDLYFRARPMLNHRTGRLLILSTPFGRRNFFFREWEDWEKNPDTIWHGITVSTSECPHMTAKFLAEERLKLGNRIYRREYECSFEDNEAAAIPYDIIERAFRDDVEELEIDYGDDGERPLRYREDVNELNELDLDFGADDEEESNDK